MTNGHAGTVAGAAAAVPMSLSGKRDHIVLHQQRNNAAAADVTMTGSGSGSLSRVPASEKIHESLSGIKSAAAASASMISVKFTREPDLKIYDSENRAQETFFNPVILSQVPLTDQEIEEQERQVQSMIREKELQQQQQMHKQNQNQKQQQHDDLRRDSATAYKDRSSSTNHWHPDKSAIAIASGSGNQERQQREHVNQEISSRRGRKEGEDDEEEKEGEDGGERKRMSSSRNNHNSHKQWNEDGEGKVVGIGSSSRKEGSTSLHPIVMHDSPGKGMPHQVNPATAIADPAAANGRIPDAAAVLLHTNSNGIPNHRSPHGDQRVMQQQHKIQHQQRQQQKVHKSGISGNKQASVSESGIRGIGVDDLSRQSIHPSIKMIATPAPAVPHAAASGSPNPERDDDYSDAEFEEKRRRAEAGETMDVSNIPAGSRNSSDPKGGVPSSSSGLPYEPVPSLEESEPEVQQRGLYDDAIGSLTGDDNQNVNDDASPQQLLAPGSVPSSPSSSSASKSRPHYGSGNFRRAAHYYKPKFLTRANIRNVRADKLRRSTWHREPAPEFCNESILIHDECDANIIDKGMSHHRNNREKRWSFNLEDGNCYQYEDPCPLFKRNSFRQLSECLATCWRQPSLL